MSTSSFDWRALLQNAVHSARLKPDEFWGLTPAELSLVLGLDAAPPPLTRARLMELDRMYSKPTGGARDVEL